MSKNPPVFNAGAATIYAHVLALAAVAPEESLPVHTLPDDQHGPVTPSGYLTIRTSSTGTVRILNTAPRLAEFAETVRKNWALFGGGPKPAASAPRRAAPAWKAASVKVWAECLEDRDFAGAAQLAESLGVRYYPSHRSGEAFCIVAPQQVAELPEGFCSARRDDGRWVVTDLRSGWAILPRGASSRKLAESDALAEWMRVSEGSRAQALARMAAAPTADDAAARGVWCAAHRIDAPTTVAAEDPPAPEVATPTAPEAAQPVPSDCMAEIVATAAASLAPDAAEIDWQTRAARPGISYATPVYRIGVHEWRTVVYTHEVYGACTDHVWRRVDQNRGAFKPAREWPTHNSDRTFSGLPVSLSRVVFEPHEAEIRRALADLRERNAPAPTPAPACAQAPAPTTAAALWGRPLSTAILRYPSGRFGIVGSVPAALTKPRGGAFPGRDSMAWDTEADAVQALLAIGVTRFQLADCSFYTPPANATPTEPAPAPEILPAPAAPAAAPAPRWMTAPARRVYGVHVRTAARAAELAPGQCGPCDDNPRQWLRAPHLAPDWCGPARVHELRARVAASMRAERAARRPPSLALIESPQPRAYTPPVPTRNPAPARHAYPRPSVPAFRRPPPVPARLAQHVGAIYSARAPTRPPGPDPARCLSYA